MKTDQSQTVYVHQRLKQLTCVFQSNYFTFQLCFPIQVHWVRFISYFVRC